MGRAKQQPKLPPTVQPPKLGAMSNVFKGTPEEVAELFDRYRLESVQILPNFMDVKLTDAGSVASAACRRMSQPFIDRDIEVAAVTAHTNFVDPDERSRRAMIDRFNAILDHCHDLGTPFVVTESGTLNPESPFAPFAENRKADALKQLLKNLEPSVRRAEKAGAVILIEGYINHIVGSVETALKVRKAFGPSIGFVMDPANYFTKPMASAAKRHLRAIFDELGSFCPIAHGKDVRSGGGEFVTTRAGTGNFDYREFLELLDQKQPACPLILEQIRSDELRETIEFIDAFFVLAPAE